MHARMQSTTLCAFPLSCVCALHRANGSIDLFHMHALRMQRWLLTAMIWKSNDSWTCTTAHGWRHHASSISWFLSRYRKMHLSLLRTYVSTRVHACVNLQSRPPRIEGAFSHLVQQTEQDDLHGGADEVPRNRDFGPVRGQPRAVRVHVDVGRRDGDGEKEEACRAVAHETGRRQEVGAVKVDWKEGIDDAARQQSGAAQNFGDARPCDVELGGAWQVPDAPGSLLRHDVLVGFAEGEVRDAGREVDGAQQGPRGTPGLHPFVRGSDVREETGEDGGSGCQGSKVGHEGLGLEGLGEGVDAAWGWQIAPFLSDALDGRWDLGFRILWSESIEEGLGLELRGADSLLLLW
mmetsp:Transcript_5512/g.14951  ORF Transcript_5512/g.14951 Transcript_5512/m.14951 type:complete len:349 (+) Transcript_5512:364-1410(+)